MPITRPIDFGKEIVTSLFFDCSCAPIFKPHEVLFGNTHNVTSLIRSARNTLINAQKFERLLDGRNQMKSPLYTANI